MTTSCIAPSEHILNILLLTAAIWKLIGFIRNPGLRMSLISCLPDFTPSCILQFAKVQALLVLHTQGGKLPCTAVSRVPGVCGSIHRNVHSDLLMPFLLWYPQTTRTLECL